MICSSRLSLSMSCAFSARRDRLGALPGPAGYKQSWPDRAQCEQGCRRSHLTLRWRQSSQLRMCGYGAAPVEAPEVSAMAGMSW